MEFSPAHLPDARWVEGHAVDVLVQRRFPAAILRVDALEDPTAQPNSTQEAVAVIAAEAGQIVETGGVGTIHEVAACRSIVRRARSTANRLGTTRSGHKDMDTRDRKRPAFRRTAARRQGCLGPAQTVQGARVPRKAQGSTANARPSPTPFQSWRKCEPSVGSAGRIVRPKNAIDTFSGSAARAPMPGIAVLRVMPCRAPGGKNGLCGLGEICGSKLGFSRAPQEYLGNRV